MIRFFSNAVWNKKIFQKCDAKNHCRINYMRLRIYLFFKTRHLTVRWNWKKVQFQLCVWVVAWLPQRLKSTYFEKNFNTSLAPSPSVPLRSKKYKKNVDFSLWAKQCKWQFLQIFYCEKWFHEFFLHILRILEHSVCIHIFYIATIPKYGDTPRKVTNSPLLLL